jgi:hypothetical protein
MRPLSADRGNDGFAVLAKVGFKSFDEILAKLIPRTKWTALGVA